MKKYKIAVLGGGNMGTLLSIKFSQNNDVILYLNSNKNAKYYNDMKLYNTNTKIYTKGKIKKITYNLIEAIDDAELIFVTFPPIIFESFASKLMSNVKRGQHIIFIPGSGGCELFFKNILKKGCTISGLQRVHSVARITKEGKEVKESGVRKLLKVASIPQKVNLKMCKIISELYDIDVEPLNSYLNITLINSNQILHTSRLYTIFKDYDFNLMNGYDKMPLFYGDWTDETSMLLEKMDEELFKIINTLNKNNMKIDNITPILKHYDSKNKFEMTNKIRSITSLKGLTTPSVKNLDGKFIPDLSSRYFIADFPLGLDILIAFANFIGVSCKNMIMVSDWYHKLKNTKREFSLNKFDFENINDLVKFYMDNNDII